ncbi:protein-glutamate O-methyltransferase CheR [bacterium]|nr:protein-glutamate O-methyltransferase CheR [bacterium]
MSQSIIVMTAEELELLNEFFTNHFGLYFPDHKKEILESRLSPHLNDLKIKRYIDYYFLLQYSSNSEVQKLATLITNNESFFFRETHQFESLFEHALTFLKQNVLQNEAIRILCAGCSSGEEPYTLKMFYMENQYRIYGYSVEIDAFDLNPDRVEQARKAKYHLGSMRTLSPDQINHYFGTPHDDIYTLKKVFRDGITFFEGNICDCSTYQKFLPYDVVFCRNVLIYFSEPKLRQAVENFARVLRKGGLLYLGHSESIIGITSLFETARFGDCIAYRKV